jgi:hypothetical protein
MSKRKHKHRNGSALESLMGKSFRSGGKNPALPDLPVLPPLTAEQEATFQAIFDKYRYGRPGPEVPLPLEGANLHAAPRAVVPAPEQSAGADALPSWQELVRLRDAELAGFDLAVINLACAAGLPGTEHLDYVACLRTLDAWTDAVREGTNRMADHFQANPAEYNHSWAYCCVLTLVTVLQRNLGVHYNPDLIAADATVGVDDVFLHGLLQGKGGTCANMPVLYVAIGRRLDYPLKLVKARSHLLVRWEDATERFNIEATNEGVNCEPDDYYRTGRFAITSKQEKDGCLLQSLTPRAELAEFLAERGYCRRDLGDYRHAVKCFVWASAVTPENKFYARDLIDALDEWTAKLNARVPPMSPRLTIKFPPQQFPHMPLSIERKLIATQVLEDLLNDKELDELLRGSDRHQLPPGAADHIMMDYPARELWRI